MQSTPSAEPAYGILDLDIELGYSPEYPNSAFIELDYEITAVLGGHHRIPVSLTVDGHRFQSSLAPMGGKHMMVFNLQMRQATGYKAGDRIHICLERDPLPRKVEIPPDVMEYLQTNAVWEVFSRYSYSHQKETLDWINDAKKPETRARRIAQLSQKLSGEKA